MPCQACHRLSSRWLLCDRCRADLAPATDRLIYGAVPLIAAFEHRGPARVLIHALKYRGLVGYAELVASTLAPRLPRLPVVPIPRTLSRLVKYGVDPAGVLAQRLARELNTPLVNILRPAVHSKRRAGGDHRRPPSRLAPRIDPQVEVLLVDDVVTTGATVASALRALGSRNVRAVVAANVVPEVSSLLPTSNQHTNSRNQS